MRICSKNAPPLKKNALASRPTEAVAAAVDQSQQSCNSEPSVSVAWFAAAIDLLAGLNVDYDVVSTFRYSRVCT